MSTVDLGTARGRIQIDSSSLDIAKAKAAGLATGLASSLKTVGTSMVRTGRTMTTSFTLPIVAGIALAVRAFNQAAEANAQTAARIKSTGAAANVTAGHVRGLADSVRDYSGIEDEAVQAGANMLLTFTQIRNRVGEGNDIFDQAVASLADVSVAMGKEMPQAAIQLGKALNDPLLGMTALRRIGVLFTAQQQDQIRTMLQNNDLLGAQKVILEEVNTEFGNSARAQGRTPWGKTKIAISQLGDQLERLGEIIAPVLQKMAEGLKGIIDFIAQLPAPVKTFLAVMVGIFAVMGPLLIIFGSLLKVVAFFINLVAGAKIAMAAFAGVTNTTVSAMSSLTEKQSIAAAGFGKFLGSMTALINPVTIMIAAIGIGLAGAFIVSAREAAAARKMAIEWGHALVSAARMGERAVRDINVKAFKEFIDVIGHGEEFIETFRIVNQGLATSFRTGGITAAAAAVQYEDLINKADEAGGLFQLWATIQKDGADASDFAAQRVSALSQEMFKAGTITKEQLVANLVILGFTMGEARTAAVGLAKDIGEIGKQTNVAGEEIAQFAHMTVEEFETWRKEVVDNLLSATPALDRLAEKAKITSRSIVVSFRRQQKAFVDYGENLAKFTKLDLPDELKQQVIDLGIEGSATMQAFGRLTDKQLQAVSRSFNKGESAIKGTSGPLKGLQSDAQKSTDKVNDLATSLANIQSRFQNLDLNITTNFHTTGTPPPGFRGQKAFGGVVKSGGMYLVGERGPELAFMPRGTGVLESEKTLALLRQMAGNNAPRGASSLGSSGGAQTFIFELDGEAIYRTVVTKERDTRIRLGSRG